MLLALNSNTYHGFDIKDVYQAIEDNHIPYVELSAVRGYTEHVHYDMSDTEISAVRAKLSELECQCIGLGAHCNLLKEEEKLGFIKAISLAKNLGGQYIVTSIGDAHNDHDVIQDDTLLIQNLKDILQECERKGVVLVLETHGNNYATGENMEALIKKLDSSYVGINYDTANVIFYGDIQPYADLKSSLENVKFVHLKDKIGGHQVWNFPAIGEGELDIPQILELLKSKKALPVSIEIEFTSKGPASIEEVHQAVKESFRYVRKYI